MNNNNVAFKPTRTETAAQNPIAAARGNAKRAEQLWHRKTGAGFALFVEYYAQQPAGVVVCGTDLSSSSDSNNLSSDGMSDKNHVREGTKNNGTKVTAVVSAGANDAGGAGLSEPPSGERKKGSNMSEVSRHRAANAVTVTPVVEHRTSSSSSSSKTDPRLCKALDASTALNRQKQALRPVNPTSQPLPLTFAVTDSMKLTDSLATITRIWSRCGVALD
jgi:hypothetical protein